MGGMLLGEEGREGGRLVGPLAFLKLHQAVRASALSFEAGTSPEASQMFSNVPEIWRPGLLFTCNHSLPV